MNLLPKDLEAQIDSLHTFVTKFTEEEKREKNLAWEKFIDLVPTCSMVAENFSRFAESIQKYNRPAAMSVVPYQNLYDTYIKQKTIQEENKIERVILLNGQFMSRIVVDEDDPVNDILANLLLESIKYRLNFDEFTIDNIVKYHDSVKNGTAPALGWIPKTERTNNERKKNVIWYKRWRNRRRGWLGVGRILSLSIFREIRRRCSRRS